MTIARRARELILVAGLLAVPLLVLRASLKGPSSLDAVDRAVLRVSAPVQSGVTSLFRAIGDSVKRYVALVGVGDENRRLLAENARLRLEVGRLEREAARVAELERALGLRTETKAETIGARVIGAELSSLFRVARVKIDRGDLEVRPGMAVISPDGVVGRVFRVYGSYCDVMLLSDPQVSVDVVVQRTGKWGGVVHGIPGDTRYRMRSEYLRRTDEVKEGDALVTSGLGGFPAGQPVGTIRKIVKRDVGLYQEVEIEPAIDPARLREVLVVVVPPPPPANLNAPTAPTSATSEARR
jgi:rod shape-determining protein MreC